MTKQWKFSVQNYLLTGLNFSVRQQGRFEKIQFTKYLSMEKHHCWISGVFLYPKPYRFGLWLRKSFSKRRRQTVYQLHCEDIQGGFKCPTQSMACEVGYPIHAEIPERRILRRKVGSNGKDFETDGVTLSLQQSAPRLYFYAGRDALLYSFTGYLKRKSSTMWEK